MYYASTLNEKPSTLPNSPKNVDNDLKQRSFIHKKHQRCVFIWLKYSYLADEGSLSHNFRFQSFQSYTSF